MDYVWLGYLLLAFVAFNVWLSAFLLVLFRKWKRVEMRVLWFFVLVFIPISCVLLLVMRRDFLEDVQERYMM